MAKNKETVVGVFMDESYAQQAVQSLKSQGFKAQIGDESTLNSLTDLAKEEAQMYLGRMEEGNGVVIVNNAGDRGEDALNILLDSGAEYMNLHGQGQGQGQSQGGSQSDQRYDANYYQNLQREQRQYGRYDENLGRARNEEEINVQLREETLTATKTANQAGEVELRKVVHEKEQQIPVALQHEQVVIERHAVDRPADAGEITDMQDEVIRVPVYEEQAQLQKQARVREEVTIGKEAVQEQQTLSGTTRHEHVEIVNSGDVEVRGDADVTTSRSTTSSGEMKAYETER
ncbi:MAG: YsnF/AvaK domain-containing protein [Chloroflexia bacterium]